MGQGPGCCCCRKRMGRQGLRGEQDWDGRWLWEVLGNLTRLLLPRLNEEGMWEAQFTVATDSSNSLLHKPWTFLWQQRGCQPCHPLQWQSRQWMVGCFATPTACRLEICPNLIPRDVPLWHQTEPLCSRWNRAELQPCLNSHACSDLVKLQNLNVHLGKVCLVDKQVYN